MIAAWFALALPLIRLGTRLPKIDRQSRLARLAAGIHTMILTFFGLWMLLIPAELSGIRWLEGVTHHWEHMLAGAFWAYVALLPIHALLRPLYPRPNGDAIS